jgi:hypothetical protein
MLYRKICSFHTQREHDQYFIGTIARFVGSGDMVSSVPYAVRQKQILLDM